MSTGSSAGEPAGSPTGGGLGEVLRLQTENAAAFKRKHRRLDALFLVASIVLGAAATVVSGTSAFAQDAMANWLKVHRPSKDQPESADSDQPAADDKEKQRAADDKDKQWAKQVIDALAAVCAAGATVSVTLHKTLKISDALSRGTACHAELASLRVELDDAEVDRTAIRKQYQQILTKYPEVID